MTEPTRQPGCRRMGAADRPSAGVGGRAGGAQHQRRRAQADLADPGLRPHVAEDLPVAAGRGRRHAGARSSRSGSSTSPSSGRRATASSRRWPGSHPGEVARARPARCRGGLKLSTGVLVLYADDESFTLMTPQGHMFAGWITFSAFAEEGVTYAQAQVLMRASDPMYELGMTLGGHGKEDLHWQHTLRSLARAPRRHGRGGDDDGVRRPRPAVVAGDEHLAQRRDTLRHLHDRRTDPPDRTAVPAGRLRACPMRSSSARGRTASRPRSSWPAPAARCSSASGPRRSAAARGRPS